MWIHLFSTLPPPPWDSVTVTVHALRVQGAGRETRCCCHVLPATSIQAAQPFLVCHFVMGNVRQLAAQTSDCFLVFAFSFIYYSFFLLVLDVCKSSCFELWREHWAWNAWWWWHLGFFMLVFAWATLCMKVELMSQEERGGICEPSCIATMGAPGSHRKTVLEDAPNPLCAKLLPIPGQVYLRDAEEERAWMFLDDEDFCILSARYLS